LGWENAAKPICHDRALIVISNSNGSWDAAKDDQHLEAHVPRRIDAIRVDGVVCFVVFFSDRRDSTYRGRVAFRGRRLADAGDGIGTWYANDARLGRLAGRTRGPVRHWTPPVAGGGVIFRASRKGGTGRRAKMAAPVGPQRPHRRRPGAGRRKARRWRQRQRRGLLVRATLSFSSESPAVLTPPSASVVVVVVVDFV